MDSRRTPGGVPGDPAETPESLPREPDLHAAVEQALVEFYRGMTDRIRVHARDFDPDLQPAGFGILRYIRVRQPIRAAEIATSLGMDKSAVSRQVAQLREMGFVETTPDPDDGRASLLVLSATSQHALSIVHDQASRDYDRILGDWSDDDLAAFARLLGRFSAAL